MRTILGCALGVLMAACCVLSADDKKDEKIDAKKLVGKWTPKDEKNKKGADSIVIEFTKDGKATVRASRDGKDFTLEGTYKLDGNKLTTTMKLGDMERMQTRTISKLTDTELVSSDDKGKEDTLIRVKGDEKEREKEKK